jgi:hypothetical protein
LFKKLRHQDAPAEFLLHLATKISVSESTIVNAFAIKGRELEVERTCTATDDRGIKGSVVVAQTLLVLFSTVTRKQKFRKTKHSTARQVWRTESNNIRNFLTCNRNHQRLLRGLRHHHRLQQI